MNKRKAVIMVLLIAVVIASFATFVHVRRHSRIGITTLGGADYWIEIAAMTPDVEEAKVHLRKVISQDGAHAAEVAVLKLDYPEDAHRLLLLLADVAPNDHWRSRYFKLAESYKDPYPKGDFDIYK
jgi:hypothetical protein